MNTLGERLHSVRKKRGYIRDPLIEVVGVSRGVIYNLEKDEAESQMTVISTICQTLNVNWDWLLYGRDEMGDRSELSGSAKILVKLYDMMKDLSEDKQLYLLDVVKALKLWSSKGMR